MLQLDAVAEPLDHGDGVAAVVHPEGRRVAHVNRGRLDGAQEVGRAGGLLGEIRTVEVGEA